MTLPCSVSAPEPEATGPLIQALPKGRANRAAATPKADYAAWPKPDEIAATIAFPASPGNRVTTATWRRFPVGPDAGPGAVASLRFQ
jgi:hypothetical protein